MEGVNDFFLSHIFMDMEKLKLYLQRILFFLLFLSFLWCSNEIGQEINKSINPYL